MSMEVDFRHKIGYTNLEEDMEQALDRTFLVL